MLYIVEVGTVCWSCKVSASIYIPKLAEKDSFDLIRIRNFVCTVCAFKKEEILHATPLFCRFICWYL
jgi:hypothetical protein